MDFGKLIDKEEKKAKEEHVLYRDAHRDFNNMYYWLWPIVKHLESKKENRFFCIPETFIIPIGMEMYDKLIESVLDGKNLDETEKMLQEYIENYVKENAPEGYSLSGRKFLKTGTFSKKFNFADCDTSCGDKSIARRFMDILYDSYLLHDNGSDEIVLRSFIETKQNRHCIYNGMKLNTEFRVFYDFDNKKILGTFNYWDRETMQSHLGGKDLENFNTDIDDIEEEFNILKSTLEDKVLEFFKDFQGIKNQWSLDFLYDGVKFWFIDAAVAYMSYYFDKLSQEQKV